MARARSNRRLRRWVLVWHRRLGLTSLVLVMVLALTGIVLNHNDALKLDERAITSQSLLSWYGLKPVERPISFEVTGRHVTYAGGAIYLDEQIVAESPVAIIGAVGTTNGIVFATPRSLTLIDADDMVAKRIDDNQLPDVIRSIAQSRSGALVIGTQDAAYSSQNLERWQRSQEQVVWSQPTPLPAELEERLMEAFRSQSLPLGRVLLDLHSGRIFGSWGSFLMDAAAVCVVLLTLSGFYNWYAARKK